jgi:hypothetical protein
MKLFQKITAFFLCLFILAFSLGFTINKMVCLKSGKVKIALTPIKECCSKKSSSKTTLKTHCCDLSSLSFQLNEYSPTQQQSVVLAIDYILPFNTNTYSCSNFIINKEPLLYSDLPPPIVGKKRLAFLSTFII